MFNTFGSGKKKWTLTQDAFEDLLNWLNPERERAGEKYENIRRRLIKIYSCRGCVVAEDLADETINRVAKKVSQLKDTYQDDPALYFYGVARKVYLEYTRKQSFSVPPPATLAAPAPDEVEPEYECLEQCIEQLDARNRDLVIDYYQEEKGDKIEHRKELAQRLGIALNALRIRAYRIRAGLQECVLNCLKHERTG